MAFETLGDYLRTMFDNMPIDSLDLLAKVPDALGDMFPNARNTSGITKNWLIHGAEQTGKSSLVRQAARAFRSSTNTPFQSAVLVVEGKHDRSIDFTRETILKFARFTHERVLVLLNCDQMYTTSLTAMLTCMECSGMHILATATDIDRLPHAFLSRFAVVRQTDDLAPSPDRVMNNFRTLVRSLSTNDTGRLLAQSFLAKAMPFKNVIQAITKWSKKTDSVFSTSRVYSVLYAYCVGTENEWQEVLESYMQGTVVSLDQGNGSVSVADILKLLDAGSVPSNGQLSALVLYWLTEFPDMTDACFDLVAAFADMVRAKRCGEASALLTRIGRSIDQTR